MIGFHRLLIGTAIAFFALFAVWAILEGRSSESTLLMVLGVLSGAVALGLAYYLKNLRRFLGQ
ncbi:MAG: hypothetical protein ACE5PT_06650 [Gemmatimonadales bacterium]